MQEDDFSSNFSEYVISTICCILYVYSTVGSILKQNMVGLSLVIKKDLSCGVGPF